MSAGHRCTPRSQRPSILQCAGRDRSQPPCLDAISLGNMSFTNAPVTRSLVYGLIGMSIAASLLDIKHYFYILVDLHLWRFHQTWRALIYQLCYTNSSEVLFAAMTLYNMRSVERLWGSRKYAVSASPSAPLHHGDEALLTLSINPRLSSL